MNSTSPPPYNPDYIEYDIKPSAPPTPQKKRKNNICCIIEGKVLSGKTTYIKQQLIKENYDVIEVCYIDGYVSTEYSDFTSMITNKLSKREWFRKELKCCLILEDCYIRENFCEILIILLDLKNLGVDIYIATQKSEHVPLRIQNIFNKKLYMTRNW